jgi:hypothetical protein
MYILEGVTQSQVKGGVNSMLANQQQQALQQAQLAQAQAQNAAQQAQTAQAQAQQCIQQAQLAQAQAQQAAQQAQVAQAQTQTAQLVQPTAFPTLFSTQLQTQPSPYLQ